MLFPPFFFSDPAAKTGMYNCSHHTFHAKMTPFKLLLQYFTEFLCMQLSTLLTYQFHPDISPELEGGKLLGDFNMLLRNKVMFPDIFEI